MYTNLIDRLEQEAVPIALVAAGLLIISLGLRAGFAYWPEVMAKRAEAQRYQRLIANSGNYRELRTRIEEKRDALELRLDTLTSGLRDARDLSGLLQMIFDKAFEAGLRIDRTEPQEEETGRDFVKYPVVLETSTTYHRLGAFISSLEKMPQVIRVERLSLDSSRGGGVEAKLLVTCFVSKEG
ncbi:MAG: type 4a pilus biogenesis protein PilO [Chitinivibrionales bacterium]|nr:type 4a pilus biogenesis protein PilO [Chitinivibrionales bacterium]MBD3355938.1 type 4a pilus biogenesis protein PilO [Chitinivibrionales bacterium]